MALLRKGFNLIRGHIVVLKAQLKRKPLVQLFRKVTRAWVGLFLGIFSGLALAEESKPAGSEKSPLALEEVVVTARKRAETVQDVAIAVGVMGAESLADPGINSFLDAAVQMPGVSFLGTGGPRGTAVSVRGIGTSSNNIGVEPSTTLMLDGEVMIRSGTINADLTDQERLEVLRGPQSTLFGKNASAGVIHYISKRPTLDDFEGKLSFTLSEAQEYKVNGVLSTPLNDLSAIRIAGYYSESEGYQKNTYPGNDNGGKYDSYGMRTQLLLQFGASIEVLLRAEASRKNTNCCASSTISSDNPDMAVRTSIANPFQIVNFYDLTHARIGFDHGTTTMNRLQEHLLDNQAASIEVNKLFGYHTLTYQGYYRDWKLKSNVDPWGNAMLIYPRYFAGTNRAKSTQHELRWTSPGEEKLDYLLGAAYFNSQVSRAAEELRCSRVDQGTVLDPDTLEVLSCRPDWWKNINGDANAAGGNGSHTPEDEFTYTANGDVLYDFANEYSTSLEATNIAVFGQLDFNITNQLKLTGGLRYLREKTELEYDGGRNRIENWPNPALGESNTTDEDLVIGKAAIQYSWKNNVMTYLSYARGYKGIGWFNIISVSRDRLNSNPSNPDSGTGALAAERPEQLELGLRSDWWDNRLVLNLTAFHIKNEDFQERVAELDTDPASPTFDQYVGDFRNIHIKSQGVELEIVARPIARLMLKASGAYTDAVYKEGFQSCPPDREGNVAGSLESAQLGQCFSILSGNRTSNILSLQGMPLANSLKKQFRVSAYYRMPITDAGDSFAFNVAYRWKDGQQSRTDQHLGTITDSFGILDVTLYFKNAKGNWQGRLFVKNALNEAYYTRLVPQPDWIGGGYRGVARRDFQRYFGGRVTYTFKPDG